jgi:hypothetical protein
MPARSTRRELIAENTSPCIGTCNGNVPPPKSANGKQPGHGTGRAITSRCTHRFTPTDAENNGEQINRGNERRRESKWRRGAIGRRDGCQPADALSGATAPCTRRDYEARRQHRNLAETVAHRRPRCGNLSPCSRTSKHAGALCMRPCAPAGGRVPYEVRYYLGSMYQ